MFIGGKAVGSSEDIVAHLKSGTLPQIIAASMSLLCVDATPTTAPTTAANMGVRGISNGYVAEYHHRHMKKGGKRRDRSERVTGSPQLSNLLLYYAPCLVAGEALGYRARLVREVLTLELAQLRAVTISAFLFSCVVTVGANVIYARDVSRYGRKVQWTSVPLFSLANGISESFAFFASFELGEWLAMLLTSGRSPRWLALFSGFFTFSIYNGLIHSWFWLPLLPVHMKPEEERGPPVFLFGFLAMSVCWLIMWKLFNSSLAFICLHALADMMLSYLIALRLT